MSVQWEDPPNQSTHTHRRAVKMAETIASRPGEWALVATYPLTESGHSSAKSRAYNIRHGRLSAYNLVGKFDATCRRTPDGWKVYVKYRSKS
jgi:hypothetical protein